MTVQRIRLVCETNMPGISILVRIDGDSPDARVFGGSDNAHGNFAPVGDKELLNVRHDQTAYAGEELSKWRLPTQEFKNRLWQSTTVIGSTSR